MKLSNSEDRSTSHFFDVWIKSVIVFMTVIADYHPSQVNCANMLTGTFTPHLQMRKVSFRTSDANMLMFTLTSHVL